jgi:hypothetical protein
MTALTACHNDPDALYAGPRAAAAAAIFDGFGAHLGSGECGACMQRECAEVVDQCLDDADSCGDYVACVAQCDGPACIDGCLEPHDPSPSRRAVLSSNPVAECEHSACLTVCAMHRNFDCVRNFDWGDVFGTGAMAIVEVTDASTRDAVPGARVRACSGSSCDRPFGEGVTDATGTVEVPLRDAPSNWNAIGHLEIEADGFAPGIWYSRVAGDVTSVVSVGLFTWEAIDQALVDVGAPPHDPALQLGGLTINAFDCRTDGAANLVFSVELDTPGSVHWYDNDPTATHTGNDGFGAVAGLAQGFVTVSALKFDDADAGVDTEVARERVFVRANTITHVDLRPLDSSER